MRFTIGRKSRSERRRLRDWLLLALRVAAVLLLAAAFARPLLGSGTAGPAHAADPGLAP